MDTLPKQLNEKDGTPPGARPPLLSLAEGRPLQRSVDTAAVLAAALSRLNYRAIDTAIHQLADAVSTCAVPVDGNPTPEIILDRLAKLERATAAHAETMLEVKQVLTKIEHLGETIAAVHARIESLEERVATLQTASNREAPLQFLKQEPRAGDAIVRAPGRPGLVLRAIEWLILLLRGVRAWWTRGRRRP